MAHSPAIPDRREAFPDEAFINDIGILGKKGSGKTTTAKGFAEQLLDAGKRICALDPTGVWWGLRLLADGKTPGYPVVIFGGSHGDVPIGEVSGTRLARSLPAARFPASSIPR
jgi:DNA helicase HerA-like ATPase